MSFEVDIVAPLYLSDCITLRQLDCGRWECECVLGYWGVTAPSVEEALREGQHYFVQYFGDGDYKTHLGL